MSAPELIFEAGDLTVTLAANGLPERVEHGARPGVSYLAAQQPGRLVVEGRPRQWQLAGMITDLDEAEVRYSVAGVPELEYTVRNSFTGAWLQRHLLQNTSSTPIRIDELTLPLLPGPDCVGWGLAAGADSRWVIQPSDGHGPLLTGSLTQGVLFGHTDEPGLRAGEVTLQAGRRFVLQWRITVSATVTDVVRLGSVSAQPMELPDGEPYEIDDPDIAVLPPDPVMVEADGSRQLLISDSPGRYPVELRSARGTSVLELCWVPAVDRVITDLSRQWLSAERSGAGIGVIRDSGSALAIQQAVIDRLTEEVEAAEDALELYTSRLLEQDQVTITDIAFLAQESLRTGDQDPLHRAHVGFQAVTRFRPGLGLAALRMLVADLTEGGTGEGILARLRQLRPADPGAYPVGDDQLLATACAVESIAATGPAGAGAAEDTTLENAVRTIGAALGFGLSGRRLGGLRPSVAAYAAAVIDMVPEGAGIRLAEEWGASQQLLAERTRTSALARLLWPRGDRNADDLADTLGWIVLARPVQ